MLRKLNEAEYRQYLDFAYELALDLSRSCYPTYADGLKTREAFDQVAARTFTRENYELLLYEEDGRALGLIEYHVLPEDKYLQPDIFCVQEGMGKAVAQFIEYLHGRWPGYTLYFGISETNLEAAKALKTCGFQQDEASLVGVLKFGDYTPLQETQPLVRVTRENFDSFAQLHAQWDGQMYWDNAHLLEDLDNWHIYYVPKDGAAYVAIYFRYVGDSMEIFGVDFAGGGFDADALRALLVRALNQSKEDGMADLTFFHDPESHPVVESVGIRTIDRYILYQSEI